MEWVDSGDANNMAAKPRDCEGDGAQLSNAAIGHTVASRLAITRAALDRCPMRIPPATIAAALGCALLMPGAGVAQGVVRGRVVDSASLRGRPGLSISVDSTAAGGITREDGQFLIRGVPAGERRLRVRGIGVTEVARAIVVRAGETTTVQIRVQSSAMALDAMRIDAAAAEREAFVSRPNVGALGLTARAMQAVPRVGEADPMRVVAMTPGVQARNDFSTGFNVRGGESDQNLVLLDDYPIYNPFHLGGLFSTFIASAARSIQMENGAFPSRYGGRLSSVIDVQSKEDPRPGVRGAAEVSVLATTLTASGGIRDQGTWMVAGRRTYADQAARLVSDDRVPYYFRDEQAHVSFRLPRGFRIAATAYDGRDVLDGTFGEISDSATAANEGKYHLDWGNLVGGVTVSKAVISAGGDSIIAVQRLSSSRFSTTLDAGSGAKTLFNELHDVRLSGSLTRYAREHTPSVGYEASRHTIDYRRGSPSGTLDLITTRQQPRSIAVYLDDLWRPGRNWLISAGLRGETMTDAAWAAVSPRFSAKYLVSDRSAFTAAAGRFTQGLHSLTYEDEPIHMFDYWRASDKSAPPSSMWQVVVGHERWLTPTRSIRVEAFSKRYGDLLEPNYGDDPRVDGDEFLTYEGTTYGADLFMRAFEAGPFSGWLAYTWARSVRQHDSVRYTPSQDRRHDLNVITSWRIRKFVAGVRLGYASGMPYTERLGWQPRRYYDPVTRTWGTGGARATFESFGGARNTMRYPATKRIDLHVERPFIRGRASFAPYLSIVNATDEKNVFLYLYRFSSKPAMRQTVTQLPFLPSVGVSIAYY